MKRTIVTMMMIFISVSVFFRGLFFRVEATAFLGILALLAASYCFIKLIQKETFLFHPILLAAGGVLILAYCTSFIHVADFRANLEMLLQMIVYQLLGVVLYDYFITQKQKFTQYMLPMTAAAGFFMALLGLIPMPAPLNYLNGLIHEERTGSTFQYINTASLYYALCFVFVVSMLATANKLVSRILLSGMGAVIFLAILYANSMGGLICGGIGLLLFLFLQPKGFRWTGIVTVICLTAPALLLYEQYAKAFESGDYMTAAKSLLFVFVIAVNLTLITYLFKELLPPKAIKWVSIGFGILSVAAMGYVVISGPSLLPSVSLINVFDEVAHMDLGANSFTARIAFFKDAIEIILPNWLFGIGGGGWSSLYYSVQDTYYTANMVHNHFLQTFLEAGILGFVSITAITFAAIFFAIKGWMRAEASQDKIRVAAVLGAFVMLAIHAAIDFDLTFVSMHLLFWTLIAGTGLFYSRTRKPPTIQSPKAAVIIIVLGITCLSLFFFRGVHFISAYHYDQGMRAAEKGEYRNAVVHYEKAVRWDRVNSEPFLELAVLYDYYMAESETFEEFQYWRNKALNASKACNRLNPFYPATIEILARVYSNAGMPVEALNSAERLVRFQPRNSANYELLARGYMEAATFYKAIQNDNESKALVEKCAGIMKNPNAASSPALNFFRAKALIALGDYSGAEKLVQSFMHSEDFQYYSQILLYVIYEKTDQTAKREEVLQEISLEDVETSVLYREMQILSGS